MALLKFPHRFSLTFMRSKFMPIGLFLAMVVVVVLGGVMRGINWGVDFKGGLVIEVKVNPETDLNKVRKELRQTFNRDFSIQELGKKEGLLLIRTEQVDDVPAFYEKIKPVLGKEAVFRSTQSIGPKVGRELIVSGLCAIGWALLGIMVFVAIRFEWQFGLCALVALWHDCLGLLAFFMVSGLEFNETAIVALMITACYSVNDTVVIFDRLRENLQANPKEPLVQAINRSLNETLARTILTASTTSLALLMLYLFGGEVIAAFSLPILVGIVIGAYSSVFIAVPLLAQLPNLKDASIKEPSFIND